MRQGPKYAIFESRAGDMPPRDTNLATHVRNAGCVGSHTDNSGRFHRTVVVLTAEHRTRFHKLYLAAAFYQ